MLYSIWQQIWETQHWPQNWKSLVYIPISKKGNTKECSNYNTIALISHTNKVMLRILQARLQQYLIRELPDVQAGFRKGRGTRFLIINILCIIEKAREYQKNTCFCFIDYTKTFVWITTNCAKFKRWEFQTTLTCLLRNLCGGQEAIIRTRHETTDWFQIGKRVRQAIYYHPDYYLTYMQNISCEC